MSTKFRKVVCDENGIGGSGEYCGENAAQLDRFDVFYHEASGGKCAPRTVLMDLEPGVIGAVALSRRFFSPKDLINQNAGAGILYFSGFYSKLKAPHRSTSIGS